MTQISRWPIRVVQRSEKLFLLASLTSLLDPIGDRPEPTSAEASGHFPACQDYTSQIDKLIKNRLRQKWHKVKRKNHK